MSDVRRSVDKVKTVGNDTMLCEATISELRNRDECSSQSAEGILRGKTSPLESADESMATLANSAGERKLVP